MLLIKDTWDENKLRIFIMIILLFAFGYLSGTIHSFSSTPLFDPVNTGFFTLTPEKAVAILSLYSSYILFRKRA